MNARPLVLGVPVIDGAAWMGGAIYVRNLIYCLDSLPRETKPRVRLIGDVDPASPYVRELARFPFVQTPGEAIGRAERLRARLARGLPARLAAIVSPPALAGIDLTFPSFGVPLPGALALHWIPDFQHVALPEFFAPEERHQRDANIRAIAAQDAWLVLSSEAAAADFRALVPDHRIRVAIWRFCTVLTEAEEGGADPISRYGLPDRYIYLPNQFWAHKNHAIAFEALGLLAKRGVRPTIVCTGQEDDRRNPAHMPALRALLSERGVAGQVRFLGLVPRADQIAIFRSASFVLQPSLFEGWSTVVEDAKALGRPMVLSDLPVHREQAAEGGADFRALLFDPRSPTELAEVLAVALDRFSGAQTRHDAERARNAAETRRLAAGRRIMDIFLQACRWRAI